MFCYLGAQARNSLVKNGQLACENRRENSLDVNTFSKVLQQGEGKEYIIASVMYSNIDV